MNIVRCGVSIALCCLLPPLFGQNRSEVVPNRSPLRQNSFNPLPLGAIEPRGWLREQLEIQAEGLTGHLDEFWKDVGKDSGWLGGTGESWERGPYYLDGLLPLAYQLKDKRLIEKAKRWVDWTLDHQRADGQIGPAANDDWWPRMVMLKVLTQYEEATGDGRVIPVMTRYFRYELNTLLKRPLRDWGRYRWQDNVYSVLWLYNRTGDRYLLELARLLHDQGYDWQAQFADFHYKNKTDRSILSHKPGGKPPDQAMQTHGVNNAMALKASPIWFLLTGKAEDRAALNVQLEQLDRYHGLPNGMFSGDEHLAGQDPSQGIELCAVVEEMFSLEQSFAVLGEPLLADRLERVAYNALPATLSSDMWSHQYDQQPNQISCTRAHRQWSTNNDDSNLFGLEPNFGCCTANLHQGWPKFVSALWMATNDGGVAITAYAPSSLHTTVGNTELTIDEATGYPFRDDVTLTVHPAHPAHFPVLVRIPSWAAGADITVNGELTRLPAAGCSLPDGQSPGARQCSSARAFHPVDRLWKDGDKVQIHFAAQPRVTHWFHNAASFERGPLVFALPLDAKWTEVKHHAEKSSDWELTSDKHWNYAVALPPSSDPACGVTVKQRAAGRIAFDRDNPRLVMEVSGRRLDTWGTHENSAGTLPVSPVQSTAKPARLELIPYGSAKLRITSFPYLEMPAACSESISAGGGAQAGEAVNR
jgi:uncharacterized protein